jgi:hypothetical protein
MSASIGEPGHETSGLTHAICDGCYADRQAKNEWASIPHRARALGADGNAHPTEFLSDPCCYCGQPTRGIYVRANATEVHVS